MYFVVVVVVVVVAAAAIATLPVDIIFICVMLVTRISVKPMQSCQMHKRRKDMILVWT